MIIFNGKKEAEKILLELKEKIFAEKASPALSVVSVGQDVASRLFIKNKKKAAKRIGIEVVHHKFAETAEEESLIKKIKELNGDSKVNGIIVQLPLPKNLETEKIISAISPKKDVDGFHKINRELLQKKKTPYFYPPFPLAILAALKNSTKDFKKKNILAVVNSNIFGQNLKNYFEKEKIKIEFIIIKAKDRLVDIKTKLRAADILITACGSPRQIDGEMIKEGAILIDGGIIVLSNGKTVGNIDRKSVEKKASFISPVPGGIGPLTIAFLLKNVYLAEQRLGKLKLFKK